MPAPRAEARAKKKEEAAKADAPAPTTETALKLDESKLPPVNRFTIDDLDTVRLFVELAAGLQQLFPGAGALAPIIGYDAAADIAGRGADERGDGADLEQEVRRMRG